MGRPPRLDLIGRRFGRLTATAYSGNRKWRCRCDCGRETDVVRRRLLDGSSQSCGCLRAELIVKRSTIHGHATSQADGRETAEYRCWAAMKQRCENPNHRMFKNYGARGIRVCERWSRSFVDFLADIGDRPSSKHSLDRVNNDSHYEPGNVRWTTWEVQMNNTRVNRLITYQGQTQSVARWARQLGMTPNAIRCRLKTGWSVHDTLTKPVNARKC